MIQIARLFPKVKALEYSLRDCVWDGPQWLKLKQCFKIEFHFELEPLFKKFLKVSDAADVDIVNDLYMLKNHYREPNVMNSQSAAETQQNLVTVGAPFQRVLINSSEKAQSNGVMKGCKKNQFVVKNTAICQQGVTNRVRRSSV